MVATSGRLIGFGSGRPPARCSTDASAEAHALFTVLFLNGLTPNTRTGCLSLLTTAGTTGATDPSKVLGRIWRDIAGILNEDISTLVRSGLATSALQARKRWTDEALQRCANDPDRLAGKQARGQARQRCSLVPRDNSASCRDDKQRSETLASSGWRRRKSCATQCRSRNWLCLRGTKRDAARRNLHRATSRLLDGRPVFQCWRALANSARRGKVYDQVHSFGLLAGAPRGLVRVK